jgi:hypothetical protein
MSDTERAKKLYNAALNMNGGKINEAQTQVRNVFVLEGVPEPRASQLAEAGRLLWIADRQSK